MPDLQKQLDEMLPEVPRCIHLAGVDGTGKTTQGKALFALLENRGIAIRYAWLRFPRFFTIPFLAYARLRGYSHREVVDGHQHGYWDFDQSWLMSGVFPWVLWFDTFLLAFFKVYIPLWRGSMILCDRFVVDTLVDLMTGLNAPRYDEQLVGRLFLRLLPPNTRVVVLDLETRIAQQRSPDLVGDRTHAQRRQMYLNVAARQGFPILSAVMPVEQVTSQLIGVLADSNRLESQDTMIQVERSADDYTARPVDGELAHIARDD